MNNSEVLHRLEKLINYMPRQKEIAEKTGINQNTLSAKSSRNSQWRDDEIQKLNNAYGIDIYKEVSFNPAFCDNSQDDEVEIDYYPDVLGSCGNGVFELSQERQRIRIPRNNFFKDISPLRKYSVIRSYGSSMQPTLYDNDKLIIEHWQDGDMIQDGKIYVFCYNDQISVKRLIYNVDEIIVKSDNPDKEIYKTKFIKQEDINKLLIIGQIVGLARDLR